jgi:hypothetical protein
MNKYKHIRKKAMYLREKHKMTLGDICNHLKMSKTTVYYWIKDTPIPRTAKQTQAQIKGSKGSKIKWKKLREKAYLKASIDANILFKDTTFRDFITIYLCEGYRRCRNTVSVANSNKNIILLSYKWIKALSARAISFKIQIHIDQDENKLKEYWGKLLDIQKDIIKTTRKSNSGNLNGRLWRSEYGVLTIQTHDTYLRSKIQLCQRFDSSLPDKKKNRLFHRRQG